MLKEAGCDYAKLQCRDIDWCYSPEDLAKPCESPWGTTIEAKVRGRELSWEQIDTFNAHDEATLLKQQAVFRDEGQLIQSAREAARELEQLFETDRSK